MKNLTLMYVAASLSVTFSDWHLYTVFYLGIFHLLPFRHHHPTPKRSKLAATMNVCKSWVPNIAQDTGKSPARQCGQYNLFSLPCWQLSLLTYFILRGRRRKRDSSNAVYILWFTRTFNYWTSTWTRSKYGLANKKSPPHKKVCFPFASELC